MTQFDGFPSKTFRFLKNLSANNDRQWFAENKEDYEKYFLQPSLAFISDMEVQLQRVAPLLEASAKKVGGSLMRIYKDTRFSKDKTPYKTNIGIHFRHRAGSRDVHSPGVYLHVDSKECFLGAGIWQPCTAPLKAIRTHIVENPAAWKKSIARKAFQQQFILHDDRLKTFPRGFDREHPLINDLRLTSYIGIATLSKQEVQSADLAKRVAKLIRDSRPFMEFLCESLGLPY